MPSGTCDDRQNTSIEGVHKKRESSDSLFLEILPGDYSTQPITSHRALLRHNTRHRRGGFDHNSRH